MGIGVAHVSHAINSGIAGTTAAVTLSATPAVGQPLVVCVCAYRPSATAVPDTIFVTDNQGGNQYFPVFPFSKKTTGTDSQCVAQFLCPALAVSSGSFTVTVNGLIAGMDCNIPVVEFSGFNRPAIVDITGDNNGTTSWTAIAAPRNNSNPNVIAVGNAGVSDSANAAWSNSSGFTNIGNSPNGASNEVSSGDYLVISSSGAVSLTYSRSATGMSGWAGMLVAYGERPLPRSRSTIYNFPDKSRGIGSWVTASAWWKAAHV